MVPRFALSDLILVDSLATGGSRISSKGEGPACQRSEKDRAARLLTGCPRVSGDERPASPLIDAPRRPSRGFEVDFLLRELAQQRVGFLLFLERLLQERGCVFQAELRRPSL